ncbi:MAG: hydantoinase B/oxoprolinase family protein [Candidatus Obscuribacterales bacterium]|nr:hydantoinase B/oxoprolinase family protein [Candidatus Obscuribacterales bacterium]
MKNNHGLTICVDRGGTFTDLVAFAPDGRLYVHKILSTSNAGEASAASAATRKGIEELFAFVKEKRQEVNLTIAEVRAGTTVATNALLTRKGAPLILITNKGLADALYIGYQARSDIFALDIKRAAPLYERVFEIDCRMQADGSIIKDIDAAEALAELRNLRRQYHEPPAVAILLMHSYLNDAHETLLAELATQAGFKQISLSSQINRVIKYVGRGDTTCADAYLTPPLQAYTQNLVRELAPIPVSFMKSDGGLSSPAQFSGKDALLSGPAGGVVGAYMFNLSRGGGPAVAFDMGGTSTDVSYFEKEPERLYETMIAGVRVRTPIVAVHTVAAGGGSILKFDGERLLAGPDSAGAFPGPACYGKGGPLTVTDANLLLGRISVDHFPQTFGQNGDSPLSLDAARKLMQEMSRRVVEKTGLKRYQKPEELALGFLKVAVEKMSRAIARVSTEKGHDLKKATLISFGGAGGQHACLIAERLGMERIIASPLAGVLSAYGIGRTALSAMERRTVRKPLAEMSSLSQDFAALLASVKDSMEKAKVSNYTERRLLFLRYQGSDSSIEIALGEGEHQLKEEFRKRHQKLFGFNLENAELIIEEIAIELKENIKAIGQIETCSIQDNTDKQGTTGTQALPISYLHQPKATTSSHMLYAEGSYHEITPLLLHELRRDEIVKGPALIADAVATTIIEPGWQAKVESDGSLEIVRASGIAKDKSVNNHEPANEEIRKSTAPVAGNSDEETVCDPVLLELYNNIFMAIAEEMGTTLQQVSHSVNIKERLDFSCAVFDSQGRLIANAPHMPVHLGSMGKAVESLIESAKELRQGDVYLSNNPYNGGTHLPDITAISPVYLEGNIRFFVASRGHHADIGGITPGSMPPTSTSIEEEGAMLDNVLIVRDSMLLEDEVCKLFLKGPYPARNINQTLSDLKAQVAANNKGIEALKTLCRERGEGQVLAYMTHVRQNAAGAIRRILHELEDGTAECRTDDGSCIKVAIKIDKERETVTVDFSGTSGALASNFNAPKAVVRAAVLYVFRTLTKEDIPLNEGCIEPIELIIPEGSLLAPTYPQAVVAGNVETSQIIVDALYQALGRLANSQGTMNNFTFGNDRYQYYETVCGGAGAGHSGDQSFDGQDAVQTHMTNSRLTDPEILENRFPVLLEEFSIRKDSGGEGLNKGGDGCIRRLRFLESMEANILSGRRLTAPQGIAGGGAAKNGRTLHIKGDGSAVELKSCDSVVLAPGESIQIETPGGGGYGSKI